MMRSRFLSSLFSARKILCNSRSFGQKNSLTYSQWKQTRHISNSNITLSDNSKDNAKDNLTLIFDSKYKPFDDKDAEIIFDVDEERQLLDAEALQDEIEKEHNPFEGLNIEHGRTGVYDIEDLIEVLKRDKAKDIFVARVPHEYGYVDYIVVVSSKSKRHMKALAQFVRKLYKQKRYESDKIPKIEGKESNNWMALDLGNIALHILSPPARKYYDLETLWSVGAEYDEKCLEVEEESTDLMSQYNAFLTDLEPEDSKVETKQNISETQ